MQHEFTVAAILALDDAALTQLAPTVRAVLGPCTLDQALRALDRLRASGQAPERVTLRAQLASDHELRQLAAVGLRRLQWSVRPDLDANAIQQLQQRQAFAAQLGITVHGMNLRAQTLAFDSDAAEVRGIQLGLRVAWRLRVPFVDLAAFRAGCAGAALVCVHSDHAWSAQVGGLLQKNADGSHLVVVARDPALAQACLDDELALHQLHGRSHPDAQLRQMVAAHRRLGAAYGFPTCCVEAFVDAFCEVVATGRAADNPLAIARAARRTKRFDPLLWTPVAALGDEPPTPLRHLPCRFDCVASVALAAALDAQSVPDPKSIVVFADGAYVAFVVNTKGAFVQTHGFAAKTAPDRPDWQCAFDKPLANIKVHPGSGFAVKMGGKWRQFATEPPAVAPELFPVVLPFAP